MRKHFLKGALVFLSILFCSAAVWAEDLRLSGIMYDEANPADSMALINGSPVKKGDQVSDYILEEIFPSKVKLISTLDGRTQMMAVYEELEDPENQPAAAVEKPKPVPSAPAPLSPRKKPMSYPQAFFSSFFNIKERETLSVLTQIMRMSEAVSDLAPGKEHLYVGPMEDANYRFEIQKAGREVIVYARPKDRRSKLRTIKRTRAGFEFINTP